MNLDDLIRNDYNREQREHARAKLEAGKAFTITFDYSFPNDDHATYHYSKWLGVGLIAMMPPLYVQRIVTPQSFVPALHLYKTLLGAAWERSDLWPTWMLEECRDSGMHLNSMAWHDVRGLIKDGKIKLSREDQTALNSFETWNMDCVKGYWYW